MFEKYLGFVEFNNWEVFSENDQGYVCGLLRSVVVGGVEEMIGCKVIE